MATFKDRHQRSFILVLTISAVKDIRERLKVDLLSRDLPKLLEDLAEDPVEMMEVIYWIVVRESSNPKLTLEEFGDALSGDPIAEASDAFLEALKDFTPSPRGRKRVGQMIQAIKTATTMVEDEMDRMMPILEKAIIDSVSGASSANMPGSSESIPAP